MMASEEPLGSLLCLDFTNGHIIFTPVFTRFHSNPKTKYLIKQAFIVTLNAQRSLYN